MRLQAALAVPLAAAALAASGCAPAGPFPSLALRPEERLVTVGEPRRPRVDPASDAALRGRVNTLLGQGRAGTRAFDEAEPAAERAIRGAGASESEGWVNAQQQLSRLEAARVETTTALAELNQLAATRAAQATNSADYALIEQAIAELEQVAAGQQARLDGFRSRIRS